MEFPSDFQIKIIGKNEKLFFSEIISMARKHFPTLKDKSIQARPSQQGTYLAISITVRAQDQATLDALYRELPQHSDVKMVL